MPRVNINIVTWNSAEYIGTCLEAVFGQTYQDLVITVVDNASSDNSLLLLKKYPDIQLLQNSSNEGFASAHTKAINHTDGDFVLTLNPDAILNPTFLEEAVGTMDAHPAVGSVAGKLLRISPETFHSQANLMTSKALNPIIQIKKAIENE